MNWLKDIEQHAAHSWTMKAMLITALCGCALLVGACSDKQPETATQTTPNPSLKSDAERLQQATAKAAEQRRRAESSPAPSVTQP
jgi:hypothetical protein